MSDDGERLSAAWARALARLPDGWQLEGLRCASTGLAETQRSEDRVAVAVGPDGEERQARERDPIAALESLVERLAE